MSSGFLIHHSVSGLQARRIFRRRLVESLRDLNTISFAFGLFLVRPRKRPKKKGTAQTPPVCVRETARTGRRGLLFRELPLWCKQAVVPSGRFGRFLAEVLGGSARKSPFPPAAKVGKAQKPSRCPELVEGPARADAVGRRQPAAWRSIPNGNSRWPPLLPP